MEETKDMGVLHDAQYNGEDYNEELSYVIQKLWDEDEKTISSQDRAGEPAQFKEAGEEQSVISCRPKVKASYEKQYSEILNSTINLRVPESETIMYVYDFEFDNTKNAPIRDLTVKDMPVESVIGEGAITGEGLVMPDLEI